MKREPISLNELAINVGGIWRGGFVEQPNGDSIYIVQKSVDLSDVDMGHFTKLIAQEVLNLANRHGNIKPREIEKYFDVKERK